MLFCWRSAGDSARVHIPSELSSAFRPGVRQTGWSDALDRDERITGHRHSLDTSTNYCKPRFISYIFHTVDRKVE